MTVVGGKIYSWRIQGGNIQEENVIKIPWKLHFAGSFYHATLCKVLFQLSCRRHSHASVFENMYRLSRHTLYVPLSFIHVHSVCACRAVTRPVLILLPVLGLTWLCGVLVHLSVVVAYVFIALNAFQVNKDWISATLCLILYSDLTLYLVNDVIQKNSSQELDHIYTIIQY